MGLLIECPECKRRNSAKAKTCRCGFALARFPGRVFWIDYLVAGERRRERIGPSKEAAEERLREVLSARARGRHIQRSPDVRTRFKDLAAWYLDLPEVKAKRSYGTDQQRLKHLLPFFGDRLLQEITPALVEAYKQKRRAEPSWRYRGELIKPGTVNRELACFKTVFAKAMKNGKAERHPAQGVKLLKEDNIRDRVLSEEEYHRLLDQAPAHLAPIIKLAYHTAMRQGEILGLTWDQVDLKEGFIRLAGADCKTQEGRLVPLSQEMVKTFKALPRGLPAIKVFTYKGRPLRSIRGSFTTACQAAGIEGFSFHDFRHTAINNWRLQGHDYFRIMAASGHKTMAVFKRYSTVSKAELKALVGEKTGSR